MKKSKITLNGKIFKKNKQVKSGYWYRFTKFMSCCDCGLCHQYEYKVIIKSEDDARIYFRAWRDEEKTKQNRKNKHYKNYI